MLIPLLALDLCVLLNMPIIDMIYLSLSKLNLNQNWEYWHWDPALQSSLYCVGMSTWLLALDQCVLLNKPLIDMILMTLSKVNLNLNWEYRRVNNCFGMYPTYVSFRTYLLQTIFYLSLSKLNLNQNWEYWHWEAPLALGLDCVGMSTWMLAFDQCVLLNKSLIDMI